LDLSVNKHCIYKANTRNGLFGAGILSVIKASIIQLSYTLYLSPGECGAGTSV